MISPRSFTSPLLTGLLWGSRNPSQVRASPPRNPRPKTTQIFRDQIGETVEVGAPSLVVLPVT
jgi:hypothetical protein